MADDIYITLTEGDPIYITLTEGDPIYITLEGGGDALPSQTGQAGKFLKTNGTNALWDTPAGGTGLDDGTTTGDIVRWNDVTEAWEVKSEPFEFQGLVLTPALASLVDAEGAIYYNSGNKAVMVCTEI